MFHMFQLHVSYVKAHIGMLDAYAHAMQVQMWKPNTWGVTTLPPYKNLTPRFEKHTILNKR